MKPDSPLLNLDDYARVAKQRASPAVWDFIAGGSEDETTLSANRAAFRRWALRPRVLSGVDRCDLSVNLLGTRLRSPVLLAPVGYQGLVHPDAELATARGAREAQSLMVVSTMSNCTLEEIAAAGSGPQWFQLYVMKDRELTLSLVRRAEDVGYGALVITVDAPRMGRRERDLRNGFALPSPLRPGNLPIATDPNLHRRQEGRSAVSAHADQVFDSGLSWSTVTWLQENTSLPIVIKGVLTREDAKRAAELGVHGLIVSNHGGRQLDGAVASLDALPEVVEGAGARCEILLDGGVRRGSDALKARALGAHAVLIGRPALWGLMTSGAEGVAAVLRVLQGEIEHAMILSGQSSWAGIDRSLVAPRRI